MDRDTALPRVLGLWDAICVVVGAIIGVGIFFTPRDVASVTGSQGAALLAWSIGGLIALLGAFTFAELGRMRPVAGGQYHVLRDAYGPVPAFLFVFCNLTAVQAGGVAIIAILCALNLGVAIHGADPSPRWVLTLSLVMIWALALINVAGVRAGAKLQDATVVAKLVTLATLVGLGLALDPGHAPAAARPAAPLTFVTLFAGVTFTLFAYGGGQQALWVAGEVKDAERTVPRAIVIGVLIVVAAYLGANWAYFDLLGFGGVSSGRALAADAVSVAAPGPGRRLAAGAVALSAFGVLNAQFLTGPRLTWAMARDGQFFAPFARLHARFATPAAAILFLALLATGLVVGAGLERTDLLTTGVVVVDAVFFALTGFALPLLRKRLEARERGPAWVAGAALGFSTLQILAIAGSVLARDVRLVALTGLAWIAVAAVIWWLFFRSAAGAGRDHGPSASPASHPGSVAPDPPR